MDPQLPRTNLGNFKQKKQEVLSIGQNTAQSYKHEKYGDNVVNRSQAPPSSPPPPPAEQDLQPILREELEIAVAPPKKRKPGLIIYMQNLFKLAGRP